MSKKAEHGGSGGWKYVCSCGFETPQIASAVSHVNNNKDHQLTRTSQ